MPLTDSLSVRLITTEDHRDFIADHHGSFLQTPAWGEVKVDWQHLRIGWFNGNTLVGAGLVLLRRTPRFERYLAYLPEGPVVDWDAFSAARISEPLVAFLKDRKVFAIKMGPQVVSRRWQAPSLKRAIADKAAGRIGDVPPDVTSGEASRLRDELQDAGWRQTPAETTGFGDFQPRYVFQLPLRGRTMDEVFAGFNQQWRRNVRKAAKAGVLVDQGSFDDLADFHQIYTETARRDGFNPRPLAYFERMWQCMRAEDPDRIRLYLARHDDELLAATTWVRVQERVWYSYGASTSRKREMQASNAIQWQMIQDAHAVGAAVYDLRGISDTLLETDPLFGLIRFKLGTGGEAVEYLGEWDYPITPLLFRAFQWYMGRR